MRRMKTVTRNSLAALGNSSFSEYFALVTLSSCLRFGYCGNGEGFCTPSTRTGPAGRPSTRRKSGAGCSLEDTEIVGGDLPVAVGGGGIKLDRSEADECFNR